MFTNLPLFSEKYNIHIIAKTMCKAIFCPTARCTTGTLGMRELWNCIHRSQSDRCRLQHDTALKMIIIMLNVIKCGQLCSAISQYHQSWIRSLFLPWLCLVNKSQVIQVCISVFLLLIFYQVYQHRRNFTDRINMKDFSARVIEGK